MKPSIFNIFLLFIGLALGPRCYSLKMTKRTDACTEINLVFINFSEFDWELEPNQTVPVYSKPRSKIYEDWDKFAFVARVPSETRAEVTMANLFSTGEDQKICVEDFSNPDGGEPIFKELNIVNRTKIEIQFTSEVANRDRGGWIYDVDTEDTSTCSKSEQSKAPDSVPRSETKISKMRNRLTKDSHLPSDVLEPTEVNSTAGYIYTRINNETDPSTSIIFENKETGETTVLGMVEAAANNRHQRESHANSKYGLCTMEQEDIFCTQQSQFGQAIMDLTHIDLKKTVDWFGVHNLKASAMVVVTTDCPNGKCRGLKVRKVEADNKISKEVYIYGFSINCVDPLSNLKMHTTDVKDYNYICFNFVCTDKDDSDRRVFQYRRYCIERNYFENE